jgi:2-methylisocitrate lyase-like PEP mutase family enzyme
LKTNTFIIRVLEHLDKGTPKILFSEKSQKLRELLNSEKPLVMPDAYDSISACMIENAGFEAVQCSGYSFSVASGYRREADVSLDENVEWTRRIVDAVNLPVMADAEDGYGNPEAVIETVSKFMEVGVAGLNLEDQLIGESDPLQIMSDDVMGEKIMVARDTAEVEGQPDLVINGRTDALKSTSDREEGLNMAIDRANLYLDVGSDLVFVAYVKTLDEVKTITKEVKGPVSIAAGMPYNIRNFSIADLRDSGVARVSLPTLLIYSSLKAIQRSINYMKEDNMLKILEEGLLYKVKDLKEILDR